MNDAANIAISTRKIYRVQSFFPFVGDGADFCKAGCKPPVCEAVEVRARMERKERGAE